MQLDKEYREFVYDKIKDKIDDSFKEWSYKALDWEFHPVRQDNSLVAVVMSLENEVHVAIDQTYKGRWLSKGTIDKILGEKLAKYGSVKTCVGMDNEIGKRFVERLGFEADTTNYVLEELNHAR
jgi:hypothetical protein|tara:strand:+ start:294 stop:665 length:372 start_codon:yes stop_codon:yes gene_type:complete